MPYKKIRRDITKIAQLTKRSRIFLQNFKVSGSVNIEDERKHIAPATPIDDPLL